jgi:membrane dipeptidase
MSLDRAMSRREFGRLAAGIVLVPEVAALGRSVKGAESSATSAARIPSTTGAGWPKYDSSIVVDFLASPGPFNTPVKIDKLTPEMLRNAAASGITAVNLTIGGRTVEDVFRDVAKWERNIRANPDVLMNVRSLADLRAAKTSGRLGLIYGFQDGVAIGPDLSRVELYHSFGLRIVQLTYNVRNEFGDGCLQPENGGLTPLGRELVAELNARRVIVDLGHCGQRTTADTIAASKVPVAISHSACRALVDFPRSKRDEELRQMAEKGGVVGIYLMPFLAARGQPSGDDVVRHIEHALKVCGEEHVGIGSDLSITPHNVDEAYRRSHRIFVDGRKKAGIAAPGEDPEVPMFVPDLNTPRRMEQIADRLLARGHSEARVEKIIGGNFTRLMKEVWGA